MDEPFVGVDLATRKAIMNLLHQLREKGKTVFVVHHELDSVEAFFDWIIMLNVRLVASGPTKTTFTPADPTQQATETVSTSRVTGPVSPTEPGK